MGSSDRSVHSPLTLTWMALALALGALIGIAATAALLNRQGRVQADDPDAPLFI